MKPRPLLAGEDVYAEYLPARGYFQVRNRQDGRRVPEGKMLKSQLLRAICAELLTTMNDVRMGLPEDLGRVHRIGAFDLDGGCKVEVVVRING